MAHEFSDASSWDFPTFFSLLLFFPLSSRQNSSHKFCKASPLKKIPPWKNEKLWNFSGLSEAFIYIKKIFFYEKMTLLCIFFKKMMEWSTITWKFIALIHILLDEVKKSFLRSRGNCKGGRGKPWFWMEIKIPPAVASEMVFNVRLKAIIG